MVVVDSVTHVCGYLYIIVYSTTIQYTGTKQCCTATHKGLSRDETLPQASFVQMLHPRMHSFFLKTQHISRARSLAFFWSTRTLHTCAPGLLLVGLALFVFPQMVQAQTAWNATDWTEYDTITIDHTNIGDDLTDFPVYVDLADLSADFWSTTPTGSTTVGTDIRVTTDDGTPSELPRELVAASSTAETGELHFKADSISSTTATTFRIYYNGTTTGAYAASDTYGAQNVWNSNYELVYHSGGGSDSTSNGRHGTASGGVTVGGVAGQLGDATDFDGVNDYIDKRILRG